MPIAANRRMMSSGTGLSRVDIYDPALVLYLPLWNLKAKGGSIKNGTGTMDISPQNLAVGANTITVTVAGTLIVNMPEGGTVASGTMTVTGSPVTVSAGIATTITTTGAIGNITCTSSNIIRSKEKNNFVTTISDITSQGVQGYDFEGTNDYLSIPHNAALEASTKLSLIAVLKTDTVNQGICSKGTVNGSQGNYHFVFSGGGAGNKITIYVQGAGAGQTHSGNSNLSNGIFYHVAITLDTTIDTAIAYVNGQNDGSTAAFTGAPAQTSRTLAIGVRDDSVAGQDMTTLTNYFNGIISELFIYTRVLPPTEMTNHYLQSKRRLSWL